MLGEDLDLQAIDGGATVWHGRDWKIAYIATPHQPTGPVPFVLRSTLNDMLELDLLISEEGRGFDTNYLRPARQEALL